MADIADRRLHVLAIPSWYPTGKNPVSGIFFREQAIALATLGTNVGVIYPELHSPRQIRNPRELSFGLKTTVDNAVTTYRYHCINYLPRIPGGNVWLFVQVGIRLFRTYISNRGLPDILHVHSALPAGVLGAHLRSKYEIPLVLTEHSTSYARQTLSVSQRQDANDTFSASHRLISVSPQLGDLLGQQFPATSGRWEWIPNIVDRRFFDSPTSLRDESNPRFVFLNIALMTEKKGQRDLLIAFRRAFRGYPNVELWLGGDGPIRGDLETTATDLEIASQVRFLGALTREQVREALGTADIFVLPSHYETFGVVVAEALAMGKPVIATRCGGPECIVRKEDGILIPVGDPEDMADAMMTMRREISTYRPEMLRKACENRFSAEPVVAQLKDLYSELIHAQT